MSRDIRINPYLGSTAPLEKPEITFDGLNNSSIALTVQDDGGIYYEVDNAPFLTIVESIKCTSLNQ